MASTENEKKFNRYQLLCHEQVERLEKVMGSVFPVHGRNHYPTLDIKLKDLVRVVSKKLKADGVKIRDIRINGGAASYIVSNDDVHSYNDLDLIFGVDLVSANDLQKIKNAALDSLLDFLPKGVNKDKMSRQALASAYVQKLVKVTQSKDRWSLISLSNNKGRNIELKFVDTMKRQFEFSVDSFQVILDSLLTFYTISESSSTPMSQHFYPTVVAESVYGNFSEALDHLHNKLIATRNPEEIRGGGLLKYCNLQVRGYTHAKNVDCKALERYMCSRFFIDFTDIRTQQSKLENYLANHFAGDDQLKYDYLVLLYNVVNTSTICLMNHERQETLTLIRELANQVSRIQEWEDKKQAMKKQAELDEFDGNSFQPFQDQQNLIIDQVYYGSPAWAQSYCQPQAQFYCNQFNNQYYYPHPCQQCPECPPTPQSPPQY